MVIGLTGGMGCGKSSVARLFADAGFGVVDSDRIVRDHLLTDPGIIGRLAARWGEAILSPEGAVLRPRLAEIIFASDAERLWLEALLHPLVRAHWKATLAAAPGREWLVEIPLLFEKDLEKEFDFTVCVGTSSGVQFARLRERGIPQLLAEQRILKQLPLAQKQDRADFVVFNDGSRSFLKRQVALLIENLRTRRAKPVS